MPLTGWIMASAEISQHETRFFGTFGYTSARHPGLPAGDARGARGRLRAGPRQSRLGHHRPARSPRRRRGEAPFIDKDGLLARMAPGVFGRTAGPPDNGQGAHLGLRRRRRWSSPASSAFSLAHAAPQLRPRRCGWSRAAGPASNAPAWNVDSGKSTLAFRFGYMGRTMKANSPSGPRRSSSTPMRPPIPTRPVDGYVRVAIPMGKVHRRDLFRRERRARATGSTSPSTPRPSLK